MSQQHKIGKHATTVLNRDLGNGVRQIVVTYQGTDVVKVAPDGKITLDSGGWETATTKTRMNQAASELGLPYHVYQKKFKWYVSAGGIDVPFFDGMEFTNGGVVTFDTKEQLAGCLRAGGTVYFRNGRNRVTAQVVGGVTLLPITTVSDGVESGHITSANVSDCVLIGTVG